MQISKSKPLIILLIVLVSAFFWLLANRDGKLDRNDSSKSNKEKRIHAERFLELQNHLKRTESADEKWMKSLSSGVVITQELDNDYNEPRGFIKFKGAQIDLGETPPWYRFHVKSIQGPLLFGEKNTRHRYEKTLRCLTENNNGDFSIDNIVSLSVPRFTKGVSGFLVKRNQNPIQEVGVIVPKPNVPEGFDASSEPYVVKIKVNGKELLFDDIQLESYEIQNQDDIFILQSGQNIELSKVCWLKLENQH